MRICCLGMVKNEADIIEAFVRHTLRFADQICLLENGSTDGTREILAELQREGLPLTVIEDPILGYFQAEKMTWLYRRAVPLLKPDFVLLLDADEFIAAPDRAALEAALATIRPGRYGALRWRNYVLRPEEMDTAEGDPPRRIRHHLLQEHDNGLVKAVVRCDHAPPDQMLIQQGNHAIGTVDPAIAPRRSLLAGLALAHYPVRSLEQIRQKVLVGWLAYAERNRLAAERPFGRHWQFGFEAMLGDDDTARAAALAMNLRYGRVNPRAPLPEVLAEAPLDAAYELRFPLRRPSALRTLMRAFAEHLAGADRPGGRGGVAAGQAAAAPAGAGVVPPAETAPRSGVGALADGAAAAGPDRTPDPAASPSDPAPPGTAAGPAADDTVAADPAGPAADAGLVAPDAAAADPAAPAPAAPAPAALDPAGADPAGAEPSAAPPTPPPADLPPLRHMLARYAPRSVLEFDCGEGLLLADARRGGAARCLGLETGGAAPNGPAVALPPGSLRRADPARPLDLRESFDLVVAIAARPRLPAGREEVLVDNIVRHAGRAILFTLPYPATRWLDRFATRGWHPTLQETLAVRLVASRPLLRHALVVLERTEAPDPAAAVWVRRAASQPLAGREPPGTVTTPLYDLDCVAEAAAALPDAADAAAPDAAAPDGAAAETPPPGAAT